MRLYLYKEIRFLLGRTLLLGYGNPDREDDGVAWHILASLADHLGQHVPEDYYEPFDETTQGPDLVFLLQLTPELAETLANYDRVCLVDAHTGAVPEEVHFEIIKGQYQTSPFTHHLTPQMLVELTTQLYLKTPEVVLISVRGYAFGFTRSLSASTAQLANNAVQLALDWLGHPKSA